MEYESVVELWQSGDALHNSQCNRRQKRNTGGGPGSECLC